VAALAEAFAAGSQTAPAMVAHCALGALKPNFAHSNIAAGMGGLTKMVMALGALQLPGQINFKQLNPHIMLQSSPFVIQRQRAAWAALPKGGGGQTTHRDDGDRHLAGMTCLGMGGTNVHMLIHEALVAQGPAAPSMRMGVRRSPSRLSLVSHGGGSSNGHRKDALSSQQREDPQLIILSGHSPTALVRLCGNLRRCMEAPPSDTLTLANVALTLQRGRRQLAAHRFAAVCRTPADLVAALGRAEVETLTLTLTLTLP